MLLVYENTELRVDGYVDSDFQSNVDDQKSTSRFIFTLNGGQENQKSSKQSTTTYSTIKAEYVATSKAAKEAVWIRKFLIELQDVPTVDVPTVELPLPLYCDNNGGIAQAKELRFLNKSKHNELWYHVIQEIIGRGDVVI